MGQGLGIKSWVQFGRESTWANAATVNHRLGFIDCTLEAKPQLARSANMPAGTVGSTAWMRDSANAGIEVVGEYAEGQLVVPMDYDGLLQFFDMIMGTATFGTYGGTVGGAGPYTHAFGPEKEFLNSQTIEIYEGGVQATNVARVLGAKVAQLKITGKSAPGDAGVLGLTLDIIGQQKQLNQTPTGSLSCIPRVPIYFSHMTNFDDGSGDSSPILHGFELTIKPDLAAPEWQMGSAFIREPIRKGLITATMKFTREYTSDSLITKFKAGTIITSAPQISFQSGSKVFSVSFNKAKVATAPQPKPSLSGLMMQEVEYECLWKDAANGGMVVGFTSAQNGAAA